MTAITLCRENDMPIIVLDMWAPGALLAAVRGETIGTTVNDEDAELPAVMTNPHKEIGT